MDNELTSLITIFTEFYYWVTVVFMFLIHVGFCMYEVGASRYKNHTHTLMKNTMLIPLVTITFYFFGWWIYFAFVNGPWISGPLVDAPWATPWSELMGTHMGGAPVQDTLTGDDTAFWARINGVFWAAFLLFSWTAASIVSGAVIERIRPSAFWILAIVIGSFTWIIDAAWGWSWNGWMVEDLGYHDAYASGVIHAIAISAQLNIAISSGGNSISGGVIAMNQFPDEYQKLRENRDLIPNMVAEMVRWQTPVIHMRRTALQDFELGGETIRKGDKVIMWYLSGNRDESVFEDPDRLIIDRPNARQHVSFGYGIHRCMGNRLAELQLKILWEEITERFHTVELAGDVGRLPNNFIRGIKDVPVRLHAL